MYNFEEHTGSFGHWQEKKENNKVSSQPAATYFLMIIASKLQSLAHIFFFCGSKNHGTVFKVPIQWTVRRKTMISCYSSFGILILS